MALAKQFYSSFKSYNDWDYYLEIWVEGYSGSASEISIGAGGPVITYGTDEQDRFSPILSSKLELPFMVTNTTQDAFIKNIREQFNEQDVYIHLYRASSSDYSSVAPLWSGFVLMDLSASPDLYYPYPVTLTAVDGLSLLKEIDFSKSGTAGSYTDSDMYSNNGRFTYWLKEILLKSGASTTTQGSTQDYKFTTAINWFNSVMPTITQSTDPFYQTKCNTKMFFSKDSDENFTVVNCYDVLKNLLKHWGARIIYWKHIYYIVQIQEYNTAESGTYANPDNIDTRTYTKTGAFDSSSDNLGDSYWTRYNLLIDSVEGGIQKLTGTDFNYLPQLKRTQAKFIDYGNKNYFGGLPYDLTTGQTDVIYQDTISDVSVDGSMILIIPLDVTMDVAYSGTLAMSLTFRMYITDGSTTYYLRYDASNTPKYYWENATTANLNFKKTIWRSNLDNIVGTQTKVGFHQQIEFKDVSGSALTLTGDWDIYTDIDNWGSNSGSFKFLYAQNGLFNTQVIHTPSSSTIYWTNTLNPNYQTPLNPSVIGQTNQPTSYNPNYSLNPTTSNSIVSYTSQLNTNPFEGKLLIVNASSSGALYGSFVSVSPNPITKDSEIVDFGDLIWGDTLLASSEGSLKVWNGSSFVKSNVIGTWGLGSTSGTNSYTEMLLSEYLYGQTKVIESPSMRLVIGETNKNQNDGSGSRPNYINPIGRLRGYSATGTTPYYIFKSGSFHLLKDEVDYQGYQIIRDTQSLTKTDDIIIGPDILQDKTNKIGQKTPQTNTLVNKLTQNSYITTVSAIKSAYGNDVAVNGIFASDSGWTKGTGWSISSNKAVFSPTGSTSDIKQDTLTNALTYKIIVTLTLSAGGLSVKAGSSGNSTVLSASGTYEIFSTCAGSTDVIFEASAAFEGYIEKVVVQQQVPVTSININAIGTAVFKTNDVLNVADVDGDEVNEFTVSSDQGASDTSIAVTSKLITEDILAGSIILVNQNDLSAQYQNKTKGTVGGFDITATSIDSGSVAISSYIDDDTFGTASATSLATSESIKAYVDGQVGASDTLQEVTDNGNTTTNNIMIGSSSSPSYPLQIDNSSKGIAFGDWSGNMAAYGFGIIASDNNFRLPQNVYISNSSFKLSMVSNSAEYYAYDNHIFKTDASSEKMRLTSGGNLGIGTSSPNALLDVNGEIRASLYRDNDNTAYYLNPSGSTSANLAGAVILGGSITGTTATFSGQVTIPATPVASTDAASKGYVDAQVGASDTLQEVTDNGNTTTNSIKITGGATEGGNSVQLVYNANYAQIQLKGSTGSFVNFSDGSTDFKGRIQYINSDNSMKFVTNTSEKMRLTSGGNLLLGSTSDNGQKLQVNGGITLADNAALSWKNSNTRIFGQSGYMQFQVAVSDKMRILANGNVGIGTISPTEKLHVVGDALITGDSHADAFKPAVSGNPIKFKNFDSSTEFARITDGGNVGIGTISPATILEISSDSDDGTSAPALRITNASTTLNDGATIGSLEFHNSDLSGGPHTGSIKAVASSSDERTVEFTFNTAQVGSTSEKMRLTSGGNVLIGTTTDSGSKLTVEGNSFINSGSLKITDSSVTNYYQSTKMNSYGTVYDWEFAGSKVMRIKSNGNVLIGTTTDDGSSKLQVNGDIQIGDGDMLRLGDSSDLKIYHDSFNSKIDANGTGHLVITQETDAKDIIFKSDDGSGGTTPYITIDGSATKTLFYKNTEHQDNVKAEFGDSGDLDIYHDGSNSYIVNATGNLEITNSTNDGDIKFRCDNGSGGNATYITLDGSQTTINLEKTVLIGTTTNSGVYKLDVFGKARVQSVFELDDVLTLNQISTPADPASGKSSIYMDSADGAIKCKINVGGTVVTRTIASFE